MAHFCPQCLLISVLLIFVSECKADPTIIDTVSASQEEDAALPCFNSTVMDPKGCYRVKMVKYATDARQMKKVIFAWPKNMQDAKRVKWEHGRDGQLHLYLTKVQKSDEGLYSCEVCQGWDCTLVKNISLKVKDCKISSAVKAEPSRGIRLNCPGVIISGQQGPKNVSWALLKGGKPLSVDYQRFKLNDTSLVISSVTNSDSSWYRCQYLFGQIQHCFDIKLIVQEENVVKTTFDPVIATTIATTTTTQEALTTYEPVLGDRKQESSGAYIAVAASVIPGTVIISALVGLFIYRRRNTLRVARQSCSYHAGAVRDSTDGYEIVNLTDSGDASNQQINDIYQQCEDSNMCTFQYE